MLCLSIYHLFYACWQVLALFEYCTLFFWLVIGFGFVWVLYHHFLTGDSLVLFENCTTFFCWQVLTLFEYFTSFSDRWQFLALFEYCTIFFWLLAGLGTVWVLYSLFLTGDRFRLCFEYCTIFFWLFSGFGIVWVLYYLFLNCDRFCLCLSIVLSFFDWWQGLVRTKFFALFFDLCHVLLPVSFFWLLPGCFVWLLSFLTGDRFWHCWRILPCFSDWWQVFALFEYCTIFFWLVTGFGFVLSIVPNFSVFRFWHCLSIVLSFSELWQVLPMSKYCTVFFLTVTGFG